MLGNYSRLSVGGNSCCFTLPFALIVDLLRGDEYIYVQGLLKNSDDNNNNNKTVLKT